MKTVKEYLSGEHDEELRVLVAETKGWDDCCLDNPMGSPKIGPNGLPPGTPKNVEVWNYRRLIPHYPTSLDACRELLEDLTDEEWDNFIDALGLVTKTAVMQLRFIRIRYHNIRDLLSAGARQICVAWLIVKGVMK